LINDHRNYTGSPVAENIIANWDDFRSKFVKVMPRDYKRILEERRLSEEKVDRELVPNG
jgi:glutamate synthase domain-containing protein 3